MKICAAQAMIAFLLCGISMATPVYSQLLEKEVTVTLDNVTLGTALNEISRVADVRIAFSTDQLNVKELVSVQANRTPLRKVLDELLTPYDIGYKASDRDQTIFVKRNRNKDSRQSLNEEGSPQFYQVAGTVTDATSGYPLAGVNVIVKGTTNGTTTDAEGNYSIHVEVENILVFSFIGYTSIEIKVVEQTVIDIGLLEDVKSLGEVVVYATGYDEVPVERTTGSFTQLNQAQLERNVGPDITSRLNGITPSLTVDQRTGNRTFFNIRGRSTISANDQPLIIVDNFPYNGDLNTINPNDIESITVLRDAAAASIWGVRAGNGVIVITTKRGTKDQALQIGINSNVTFGERPDLFYQDRMSTGSFIDMEKYLFGQGFFNNNINDARSPSVSPVVEILLQQRNGDISEDEAQRQLDDLKGNDIRKDMRKYFYQTSVMQQYALNVSGGTERHSFYLSAGFDQNAKALRENEYQRTSLNVQNTFRPFRNFEIDSRIVYTSSKDQTDNTASQVTMGSKEIYPYARLADDNGKPVPITYQYRTSFIESAQSRGLLNWENKPLEELGRSDRNNRLDNLRLATGIRYTIIDGLNIDFKHQYEKQKGEFTELNPVESYFTRNMINQFSTISGNTVTRNVPLGAIRSFTNNQLQSHNGRLQINFHKNSGLHEVNALGGMEVREVKGESYSSRFYGYDITLGSAVPVNYTQAYRLYPSGSFSNIPGFNSIGGTIDRFRSYYANAAYTWNSRYTLSASGRVDQSNLFGVNTNQKSNPLWSVGGKWNIDAEKFYSINWLPSLSFRATYGFNGNIDQTTTAYTTAVFTTNFFTFTPAAFIQNPPNPDLRWEKSKMLNIGLDFSLINNIVTGSVEFYQKNGIDLIGQGPLDPTTGRNSFKGNVASMRGRGWDIELNSNNLNRKIKWSTTLLASYTTDEVTEYKLKNSSIANYFVDNSVNRFNGNYTPVEGRPVFSIYSFRSAGLDPETGSPRGFVNGQPTTDYSQLISSATVDSLRYHGSAVPKYFGAIRNTLSYKRFTLSFNMTYRLGYYFRRSSVNYYNLFNFYRNGHGDFERRWQAPGDEMHTQVPSMIFPANSIRDTFYGWTEGLVEKGDHLRLQDIQLAYTFNSLSLGKVKLKRLQLYSYVNNIGLIWKANKQGLDPDFPIMPLPRTYAAGLRIDF
jgi:TonB-linked SusC/RagA family outer membrane protein